ncbi:PREDICTED: beta-defensin 116 [Condylura cristata]|uniref:beta-defensin 116 n=1 Tax=Condylura cristata TaxID=143302 RepID=UPI00064372B7|nr:PREDICTED: beta-defensin 116 [Condylura cristata]
MSIMKLYLMVISILLILVHKTPGDLSSSYYGKSPESWSPCTLYHGMFRNACREYQIQCLACQNDQKCCLKLSVKIPNSNKMRVN